MNATLITDKRGASHQVDVGHEVPQHGGGHSEGPHPVGGDVEHLEVEVLADGGVAGRRAGEQRAEGERQQGLDEHEDAEDLERAAQAQGPHHLLQQHGEGHGEQAAPRRHHAVGQAQPAPEVVAQDHQRRLEGEGRAAAEQDAVREVADAQGPAAGTGVGSAQGGERPPPPRGPDPGQAWGRYDTVWDSNTFFC